MPAIGMSTSSSLITGSGSAWRSRLRFRFLNRSRLRPPRLSSSYCVARVAAAGRHRLPVPAAAVLAAAVLATVLAAAVLAVAPAAVAAAALLVAPVPASTVAAATITAAAIPASTVASLVTAARGLVVAAPVPAPPVATLRLAARGLARLGVLAGALRCAAGLLGSGWLSRGLLGHGLLSLSLLGRGLPGLSPRGPLGPAGLAGRGRLVEAELLLRGPFGAVRADPDPLTARAGADACRGTVSDTRLRMCGWFHAVLLPQAGRVSSRGRDTLV